MSPGQKHGPPSTADQLRRAFLGFFEERGHTVVPSSSLIPHDPTMLLTTAGMVQFKPYMLGQEPTPYPRATSVQKCFRTTDIDIIGTTTRHLTFFEMLGNFSLGDYFKELAIPYAWEFITETLAFDADRLWVTVYEDDDEAEEIWADAVGFPKARIQRLGADSNFWAMGATGPCGPSSEIFLDRGPDFGHEGGPANGGEERYVEFWNLVFMQFNRTAPDPSGRGSDLEPLPQRNIDTGSGLERVLALLQGTTSVFETDVLTRLVDAAQEATGKRYGGGDEKTDVSLRIIGEHGRAASFLVSDGVTPSNEERGYVLRRIIRRAVRHAVLLGADNQVMPALVAATVETMGEAYPDLKKNESFVSDTIDREEARFRKTLDRGLEILDDQLESGDVTGDQAFLLHDTLGFPIDLTREIAEERGRTVDLERFDTLMDEQRSRAKSAHTSHEGAAAKGLSAAPDVYRSLLESKGASEFLGYGESFVEGARILALLVDGVPVESARAGDRVEAIVDRTPFYAESGGQVGDTGVLETTRGGVVRVTDTKWAIQGSLAVHRGEVEQGEITLDEEVSARVESTLRQRTARNHTGTHLLHWALREVLGDHVRQQGSLVAPDRLRFDFAHYEAVSPAALAEVEAAANEQVLTNASVRAYETTKEHAASLGALAFFGDKYGDLVRVVEAGEHSVELCGGTHVHALGSIGPIKVLGEGSIGANVRRIEALTGDGALSLMQGHEEALRSLAVSLNVTVGEIPARVERLQSQVRELQSEMDALRSQQALGEAKDLAASGEGGVVVVRRDGLEPDDYKKLVEATRDALGSGIAVVAGVTPDHKAAIAAAVSRDLQGRGVSASDIVSEAARTLQGGTAKNPDVVVGGGKRPEAIDEALTQARGRAHAAIEAAIEEAGR